MMRSKSLLLASLLLIATLVAPASAGLFGPPKEHFKGRINYLAQNNFALLTDNNQMIRIMVARDRAIPPQVQIGVRVEIQAVQGMDKNWYLDKFEKIQLQPNPNDG